MFVCQLYVVCLVDDTASVRVHWTMGAEEVSQVTMPGVFHNDVERAIARHTAYQVDDVFVLVEAFHDFQLLHQIYELPVGGISYNGNRWLSKSLRDIELFNSVQHNKKTDSKQTSKHRQLALPSSSNSGLTKTTIYT